MEEQHLYPSQDTAGMRAVADAIREQNEIMRSQQAQSHDELEIIESERRVMASQGQARQCGYRRPCPADG